MADDDEPHGMEEVPLRRPAVNDWPKGVRKIGMDELDCLGIDRHGGFYWQGKQVNVKRIVLTFGQKVYAFVGITAAALGSVRNFVYGRA